jgi:hypothetical protein
MNTKDYETGVPEELEQGPILPDRLTHQVPKGADHPTPFAKGTIENDDTPSGFTTATQGAAVAFGYSQVNSQNNGKDEEYYQPPAGWSVEKVHGSNSQTEVISTASTSTTTMATTTGISNNNKRQIEDDSDLDYIPYEEFSGRKEGYVFRLGSKGIGYYTDRARKLVVQEKDQA